MHARPPPLPSAHLTAPCPPSLRLSPSCSLLGQYAALLNGTYACMPCKPGYYRSGDASPSNNVCRPIPAGYMELSRAGVAPQSQIVPCPLGTASSWSGNANNPDTSTATRLPAAATQCAPCTLNQYGPRTGMAQCVACAGGTVPGRSRGGLAGPDSCVSCAGAAGGAAATGDGNNTFRNAFTLRCAAVPALLTCAALRCAQLCCVVLPCCCGVLCCAWRCQPLPHFHQRRPRSPPPPPPSLLSCCSATCAFCTPGSETAPSGYQACTQCQPGFVMAADGAGHAASDACSACPMNYYQAQSGQSACTVCPAGTETEDTGNSECTQCAKGFYNNVAGEPRSRGSRGASAGLGFRVRV